jgi:hypothetical protein
MDLMPRRWDWHGIERAEGGRRKMEGTEPHGRAVLGGIVGR